MIWEHTKLTTTANWEKVQIAANKHQASAKGPSIDRFETNNISIELYIVRCNCTIDTACLLVFTVKSYIFKFASDRMQNQKRRQKKLNWWINEKFSWFVDRNDLNRLKCEFFDLTLHKTKSTWINIVLRAVCRRRRRQCYAMQHKVQHNWLIICVVNSDDRTILIAARCFHLSDRSKFGRSIDRSVDWSCWWSFFSVGILTLLFCIAIVCLDVHFPYRDSLIILLRWNEVVHWFVHYWRSNKLNNFQ